MKAKGMSATRQETVELSRKQACRLALDRFRIITAAASNVPHVGHPSRSMTFWSPPQSAYEGHYYIFIYEWGRLIIQVTTQRQGELKELGQVTHRQGQSWDLSSGNLLTNENFLIHLIQVGGIVDSKIPILKMERPKLERPCDMPSKFLRDLGWEFTFLAFYSSSIIV